MVFIGKRRQQAKTGAIELKYDPNEIQKYHWLEKTAMNQIIITKLTLK